MCTDKQGSLAAAAITAVALAVLVGCAGPREAEGAGGVFDKMDRNRDAKINNAEFTGHFFHLAFAQFDADSDSTVSREEWRARETGPEADALFAELDTDGSGRIMYEEFTHPAMKRTMVRNMFLSLDANGDGVLDKSELAIK